MKKMIVAVFCAILVCTVVVIGYDFAAAPAPEPQTPPLPFLHAEGSDVVDENGVKTVLRGVNAGGLFVQESWMCPTNVKDQVTLIATLTERFGAEKTEELFSVYEKTWWQDSDFANVKQRGFNVIRLPFAYFTVERGDAYDFSKIDAFIEGCKKYGLYCILDLHGAHGSQNGKDHSGDTSQCDFFTNESNIAKTERLWCAIAERYKNESNVAGYDLLNEPEGEYGFTGWTEWNVFARLINSIRAEDSKHIIILESVWEANNLPSPKVFEDNNLMYEYHNYPWGLDDDTAAMNDFIDKKIVLYEKHKHGVPILIGEFSCFGNVDAWEYALTTYEGYGCHWTMWTYKVVGSTNNWGLYRADCDRVNPAVDSYEEIVRKWSAMKTELTESNPLYEEVPLLQKLADKSL